MVGEFEARMLTSHKQPRSLAKIGKCLGDWTKLDGFRTCSNDERDTRLAQLSP